MTTQPSDWAEDGYTITVCQGPPRCDLTGDAAEAAIAAGCPYCTRIYGDEHGNERVIQPGNA